MPLLEWQRMMWGGESMVIVFSAPRNAFYNYVLKLPLSLASSVLIEDLWTLKNINIFSSPCFSLTAGAIVKHLAVQNGRHVLLCTVEGLVLISCS